MIPYLKVGQRLCTWCYIFAFALGGCKSGYHIKTVSTELYPVHQGLADSAIIEFYRPFKAGLDSQMNTVVAISKVEITRSQPEGPLNNLVADAMADVAAAHNIAFDMVHTNYKGLRRSLPQGELKTYHVYELMPFENYLVTLQLRGYQVQTLFDYMAANGGDPISKATFRIKNRKAVDVVLNGRALDAAKTYTILTSDYLANGGDEASVYLEGRNRTDLPLKLRDVILSYLRKLNDGGRMIDPKADGRIKSDN